MKRPSVTSFWWPIIALLLGCCLLWSLFLVGYTYNRSGFLEGLKAQDWATIASGIFAALAFAGFMVSIFYQRAEIANLETQVAETVQALRQHAVSLEAHAAEVRLQTNAVLDQVECQREMLLGQLLTDIDRYIESIESAIGEKLEELFRRLNAPIGGISAFEELLKKDKPANWLAATVRRRALREGEGQEALAQFLESRRINVIFNTILNRCDLVSESVNSMAQQAPHMRPRIDARLADSRIRRIQMIIRYTREDLERRPANAA